MTHIVRDSFEKVMKMLENRYGALKVISIERGEGSFGVAISVSTVKDDTTLIIKTQKCSSCRGNTHHADAFIKEVNAINRVVKDETYQFLMPYICAYYPTQIEPYWFEEQKGKIIELSPSRKRDAVSLGLIVMEEMDQTLVIDANERKRMTDDTIRRGGWLSFVWSGSLLGVMGELMLSGSFHGDLKEENIVGSMVKKNDPFSFVWKAIDFGGAGNASSSDDFAKSMYTPHYQPIHTVKETHISYREYTWIHDMMSLAHIVRNICSFMTSTTRNKTPYSGKNSVERFFMTPSKQRMTLTRKVLDELPTNHRGIEWCKGWIEMLLKSKWNTMFDIVAMIRTWLKCSDELMDEKPKLCYRIGIRSRLQLILRLLQRK